MYLCVYMRLAIANDANLPDNAMISFALNIRAL